MRVRMLAKLAEDAPDTGAIADVDDAQAAELIRAGYAQQVDQPLPKAPAKKSAAKKAGA